MIKKGTVGLSAVLARSVALLLSITLVTGVIAPAYARADQAPPSVGTQIAGDLIGAGVSIAAAMSGNVPLAFMAGYLTKYITTYGVAGIKSLIEYFKGYQPQDLGEINLYYVYLLNVKRNLYQALITVRKAVKEEDSLQHLDAELTRVENLLTTECAASSGCQPTGLDYSLINFQFLNMITDAHESLVVSRYLAATEVKDTYQYLMLLYLDVIITEQKLIEAQYNVLANRTVDTLKVLKKNKYISNAEKEYQAQMLLNMALRWIYMADTRRVIVAQAIAKPLAQMISENAELQREIDLYRNRTKKWAPLGRLAEVRQ